jgi:hypothetical protein
MATSWPTAVSRNLLASLLWALPGWIGNGGLAVWLGYMSGLSVPWLLLIAVSTLCVTVLVVVLRSERDRRVIPVSTAFTNELRLIVELADKRSVYAASDGRPVEFDVFAREYFEGRPDDQKHSISLAIAASPKTRYNEYDLRRILSGERPIEEEMYVVIGKRGVRFWSRSEIKALPEHEQKSLSFMNRSLWTWHIFNAEVADLLREAIRIVERRASTSGLAGLADLQQKFQESEAWQAWAQRANEYLLRL